MPSSWNAPNDTIVTNVTGQTNLFEAIRALKLDPVVQIACSSEQYGLVLPDETPIKETNPLRPLSPYAVSKVAQDYLGYQYFQSYGIKAIRTRGFNHTGPRRGQVFVTSNFCSQVAAIELGLQEPVIRVGNIDAIRDFTDVRDMVRAYWLAVTKAKPGEVYNIATGHGISIRDMLEPRALELDGRGQDRGRPGAPAPLGRRDPDRRQLEVPGRHRLGAAHPVRADRQRSARLLAQDAHPPPAAPRLMVPVIT